MLSLFIPEVHKLKKKFWPKKAKISYRNQILMELNLPSKYYFCWGLLDSILTFGRVGSGLIFYLDDENKTIQCRLYWIFYFENDVRTGPEFGRKELLENALYYWIWLPKWVKDCVRNYNSAL